MSVSHRARRALMSVCLVPSAIFLQVEKWRILRTLFEGHLATLGKKPGINDTLPHLRHPICQYILRVHVKRHSTQSGLNKGILCTVICYIFHII